MDGKARRDEGIKLVMSSHEEWRNEMSVEFNWWLENCAPVEFTLEQFRNFVEACDFPAPSHPNAWGGLAHAFKGRIKPVGYTTSIRPAAHARLTRTYRRA